ncbi:hypothetical protein FQZ97_1124530 [compost metagenome]
MVRSQCRVLASRGAGVARQALTVRLSPASGRGAELLAALKPRMAQWMGLPGLAGVHLLRHETPPIATTTEQKIRGADQTADWVLVACGYDAALLGELAQTLFSEDNLTKLGARPGQVNGLYALSHSATVPEIQ